VIEQKGETAHSNRAGRTKLFFQTPSCDDPRAPHATSLPRLSPAKFASPSVVAGDNDGTACADAPCPARSPDTAAGPCAPTTAAPPPGNARCNSPSAHSGDESDNRTPPKGRSANAAHTGELVLQQDVVHAGLGPRECASRKVKSRIEAINFNPRRLFPGLHPPHAARRPFQIIHTPTPHANDG
jgi:hypothetical protein